VAHFQEWASCFREWIFVILKVYADESDTYRDGPTPSLYGFIQTDDYWVQFSKKWQMVLDDFGAPYFHFREFANRINKSVTEKSPYKAWSEKKKDRFLYDLALLCADGAIPVGASYSARHHREFSAEGDPYEVTIDLFWRRKFFSVNSARFKLRAGSGFAC
jgi:hypothetical protein